jgi:hypothetical protein
MTKGLNALKDRLQNAIVEVRGDVWADEVLKLINVRPRK